MLTMEHNDIKSIDNIILDNEYSRVVVCPELGGALLAYQVRLDGEVRSILRNTPTATKANEGSNYALLPYSNRILNGRFLWRGAQIQLPLNNPPMRHSIHGHGWQNPWDVKEKDKTSVTLSYRHKADSWPFDYSAKQQISIQKHSLLLELSLKNEGYEEMPAGLGFHPYFTRTAKSRVVAKTGKMWAVDEEVMPTELVNPPLDLARKPGLEISNHQLDNVFTDFSGCVNLYWPEWRVKAQVTTSEHCCFMVLFSPEGKNFYCVEPVTHSTDAINRAQCGEKNTGYKVLKPGEELSIFMSITPQCI